MPAVLSAPGIMIGLLYPQHMYNVRTNQLPGRKCARALVELRPGERPTDDDFNDRDRISRSKGLFWRDRASKSRLIKVLASGEDQSGCRSGSICRDYTVGWPCLKFGDLRDLRPYVLIRVSPSRPEALLQWAKVLLRLGFPLSQKTTTWQYLLNLSGINSAKGDAKG